MKKVSIVIILFSLLAAAVYGDQDRRFSLELEGNAVWNSMNDVGIPGDTGTRFSLTDTLNVQSKIAYRLRLSYQIGKRHSLSLLYAPLSLKADGILPQTIFYTDRDFLAGSSVDALYRFNSYRLTYAYTWVDSERILFKVGFTAKIRDAEIAITDAAGTASKTNVGFVPLAHLTFHWKFSPRLHFITDLDALAAKQGRAEDLFVGLNWLMSPQVSLKIGYRTVEGGADVDEVYNFAWLHYIAAGLRVSF